MLKKWDDRSQRAKWDEYKFWLMSKQEHKREFLFSSTTKEVCSFSEISNKVVCSFSEISNNLLIQTLMKEQHHDWFIQWNFLRWVQTCLEGPILWSCVVGLTEGMKGAKWIHPPVFNENYLVRAYKHDILDWKGIRMLLLMTSKKKSSITSEIL